LKNLNPNKAAGPDNMFSISAFSVGSECKVPSDLRGGICFPSDLLCFIKVQNLFIQFDLSFVWSLSGGETILSGRMVLKEEQI
jgi:hypothetical protein